MRGYVILFLESILFKCTISPVQGSLNCVVFKTLSLCTRFMHIVYGIKSGIAQSAAERIRPKRRLEASFRDSIIALSMLKRVTLNCKSGRAGRQNQVLRTGFICNYTCKQ